MRVQSSEFKVPSRGERLFAILCVLFFISGCGEWWDDNDATGPSQTITFSGTSAGSNSVYMAKNDELSSGDTLAIDIKTSNVSNVFGAAFDMDFDSSKMTYDSYAAGSFLESGGSTVNYQVALQSGNSGKIVVGISRQGAVSGVSGSETLVTLKFKVSGNSSVTFSNYELRDSSNQSILGISWYGGTVVVQ